MAVFKCKSCGAPLEVRAGATVVECEYCGNTQTVSSCRDENILALFNRANNLRIKCDFDAAASIYEKIILNQSTDAEAYWGLILCKYGIEYVEDPKTFKRIPTCHRTSMEAITADEDYRAALQYASADQKRVYEAEAREIDRLQKEILAVSAEEEPYDVFICYKETDEEGNRTPDSGFAEQIYYELSDEGFKVFYAAITLKDKLGSSYEPVIYAALSSAKVMLVLGTKPEYFEAVWVKNEWSRFMKMNKNDRSKLLIPCYRDMDPTTMPEEFRFLQGQNMADIGFARSISRKISALLGKDKPKAAAPVYAAPIAPEKTSETAPLLERAYMFLEDGDWSNANTYFEKVLDREPKNGPAYLGKLLVRVRARKQVDLRGLAEPFDNLPEYKKALQYVDSSTANSLRDDNSYIRQRNEENRLSALYTEARKQMEGATTEAAYKKAAEKFRSVAAYRDARSLADTCDEKAEEARKESIYRDAMNCFRRGNAGDVEEAIRLFGSIPGYRDADAQIGYCRNRLAQLQKQQEEERQRAEKARRDAEKAEKRKKTRKRRRKTITVFVILALIAAGIVALVNPVLKFELDKDHVTVPYGSELQDAGVHVIVKRLLGGEQREIVTEDMVSNYNSTSVGVQHVTVAAYNKTAELTLTVEALTLPAPTVSVKDGALIVEAHELSDRVVLKIGDREFEPSDLDRVVLDETFPAGEYTISAIAYGNGKGTLDSAASAPITVTRGEPIPGAVTVEDGVAAWPEGKSGTYNLYVNGAFVKNLRENKYNLSDYSGSGTLKITVCDAGGTSGLESLPGEELSVRKLGTPGGLSVSGDTVIWVNNSDALGYEVIVNGKVRTTLPAGQNSISRLSLYPSSGSTSTVTVRAIGNGKDVISSPSSESISLEFMDKINAIINASDLQSISGSKDTFYIVNDIDLGGAEWTPIPDFQGKLIGNENSIRNLTITSSTGNVGLFANLSGSVSDLCFEDVNIAIGDTVENVGALCGTLIGSADNVKVSGTISAPKGKNIGGVAGFVNVNDSVTMAGLSNSATVSGAEYVGGIFGTSSCGNTAYTAFKNSGTVTGTGNYVGGLCGMIEGRAYNSSSHTVKVLDSSNTGTVKGVRFIGGLFGSAKATSSSSSCVIQNSSNASSVEGESYVGGLAGEVEQITITSCSNKGSSIQATKYYVNGAEKEACLGGFAGSGYSFKDCVNEADLSYTGGGSYVGGIAGCVKYNDSATMEKLENKASVSGTDHVGGIFGYYSCGTTSFSSFKNSGAVTGTGNYVGGLCGLAEGRAYNSSNHTVKVLDSSNTGAVKGKQYVGGLFGSAIASYASSSSVMQNCSNASSVEGEATVGGLAGEVVKITLSGCTNTNTTVKATKYTTIGIEKAACLGGFAGIGYEFKSCVNEAALSYTGGGSYVGGIAGYVKYDDSATMEKLENTVSISGANYVGGIFGYYSCGTTSFSSFKNSGAVTGTGNYVGGLCGFAEGRTYSSSTHTLKVLDSSNTGAVKGKQYVGGLFGSAISSYSSSSAVMQNCSNASSVEGEAYVGGFAGEIVKIRVENSSNAKSTVKATKYVLNGAEKEAYLGGYAGIGYEFKNCVNEAALSYTGGGKYVGGIAGYAKFDESSTMEKLENKVSVSGADYVGGIFGFYSCGSTTFTSFHNSGAVTGTGNYVGGLCGYAEGRYFNSSSHTIRFVDSSNSGAVKGKVYVGGLCGSVIATYSSSNSAMQNCSNTSSVEGEAYVGALAGEAVKVFLTNCSNANSTVKATKYVLNGTEKLACVGGYVGSGYEFNNCVNEAAIAYTGGGKYVGGIAGYVRFDESSSMTGLENKVSISGADYVGGIFGYYSCGSTTFTSFTNSGAVTGTGNYVGGLCGYAEGRNYGSTSHYIKINNSTNTGTITGNSYVGGLCGYIYASYASSSSISSCTATGKVTGKSNAGKVTGKAEGVTVS